MAINLDSWQNEITGAATYERDKRERATVKPPADLTQSELEDLYAGDDIARKAIDVPAQEMARAGGVVKCEDPDLAKALGDWVEEQNILARFEQAQSWANLHGGAGILLGVPGDPSQPLMPEQGKPIEFTTSLDRWSMAQSGTYTDPAAGDKYKLPSHYQIAGVQGSARIHESRFLIFEGQDTTHYRRQRNGGWADSTLVPLLATIRDFDQAWASSVNLIMDFAQAVFKIKDLQHAVMQDQRQLIKERIKLADLSRSVMRAVVIDGEGEEFERKATPLTGLPEMITKFELRVAAAVGMPATILFGRSPEGMNATGESDMRIWYDRVERMRMRRWYGNMMRLLRIICLARNGPTEGILPDGLIWEWGSLWEASEKEKAESRNTQAKTDQIYWTMGALTSDEIRANRFEGDGYDIETQVEPQVQDDDEKVSEVQEVTGIVLKTSADIIERLIVGTITEGAARVLLKSALRLKRPDIDAMLEGVAEERERRRELAESIGGNDNGENQNSPPDESSTDDRGERSSG